MVSAPPPAGPPVETPDSPTGVTRPRRDDPVERDVQQELRRRFLEWQSVESEWLQNARFELDFQDNHWKDQETGRELNKELVEVGRSGFNIDLLTPAIDLVVNQLRINKVTANFIPMGGKANAATADIRQGLYRNIERVSKAAIARETAYQMAVSVGRGYYRILIEDEDGPTFAKRISIQRVDNLNSIAMDPTVLDFNYADAEWGWAYDDLWKNEFVSTYRTEDVPDLDTIGLGLSEDVRAIWFPKEKVRVGEYFRKKWRSREVWRLADRTECWKEDAPPGSRPTDIKTKPDYVIEWRKMTGTQTLEKRIWPGRYIPIVVMIGREVFRGTKPKIHRGMIRPSIDPSRIHDVLFSRMVDEVVLSPLPHMLAATGQLSPEQKGIVNDINRRTWSVVEWDADKVDADGRKLPRPEWVHPSPNTGAVVQAAELASQKLDRVLNTYAPNRGQAIADQSGRAIREIKDSGDVSHAAFPDNANRAILHEATIVNDLMNVVYTDKQAITITQPDEKTMQVLINQEYRDPKTGKIKLHLFSTDAEHQYGVTIGVGPSYPSRMAEASQKLLDLAKIFPGEISKVLYLLIGDLGVPNADKYKDVLAPPGVGTDDGPSQQQLAQHVQQLTQVNEQGHAIIEKLLQKVQQLGDTNFLKRLEIASKEKIAAAGDRTTLMVAELKNGHEAEMAVLNARLEAILAALEQPDESQPEADQSTAGQDAAPSAASPDQSQVGIQAPAEPDQAGMGAAPMGM